MGLPPDIENGSNSAIASPAAPLPAAEEGEANAGAVESPLPIVVPSFQLDSAEYLVQENATVVAVQISRQGDLSSPASVEWTTFSGSAESQLDYASFFRRQLQFAAGEETKTIFIPIVSDATAESDEDFQVALSTPGGDMILAHPFTATVTIIDDDV